MNKTQSGLSLIELLTVVAIIGIGVAVTMPSLAEINRKQQLKAAARAVASDLRGARALAIAHGRNVGVRFRRIGGEWRLATFEDGDFDGIRSRDIADGIDRMIRGERPVMDGIGDIEIGLPTLPIRDPDTDRVIPRAASPVRFGQASLCSFAFSGSATSGSVFLTDGTDDTALVRVYGPTGRVRLMMWHAANGRWSK